MKLTKKEKLFYGVGDLASNITFSAISFYLMYFMVKVGGLKPALAGLVFIVTKVWDAVTDYLMGRITDKTRCSFGKRRIYMLAGAIPWGISFVLLWLVPTGDSQFMKFLYYVFIYMLFCTFWTIVYIPYNTLSANMTNDYDERTSLTTFRIILANVGILLGAAVFSVLAEGKESVFYAIAGSEKGAYLYSAICFAVLAVALMLLCTFNVHERVDTSAENSYGFFSTLKQFFKLKEFRSASMYYLLSMLGFDVIMTVYMFYVSDTLGFGGGVTAMIFVAIPLVCAMLSAPFWTWLSEKKSKTFAYCVSAICATVSFFMTMFIPVGNGVMLGIVAGLGGLSMSAIQIIPWAVIPDVVDIDEYKNGVRREGAIFGLTSFLYKLANGVAIAIVGVVLGAFGYVEGAGSYIDVVEGFQQPESALLAIRILISCLPGTIFLLSLIFARKSDFNRSRMAEIHAELDRRREQKETSVTVEQTEKISE